MLKPEAQFCAGEKRKRPRLKESRDARSNSPPPKSAHRLPYVLDCTAGMALTCMQPHGWGPHNPM